MGLPWQQCIRESSSSRVCVVCGSVCMKSCVLALFPKWLIVSETINCTTHKCTLGLFLKRWVGVYFHCLFVHMSLHEWQRHGGSKQGAVFLVVSPPFFDEPNWSVSACVPVMSLVQLAAMLNKVRWCHAGQVTLFGEHSCHGAETVPSECQSVIIILMTRVALLAMSSLVCAKANEQHPNCKINWKTFWLKTTLPHPSRPPSSSTPLPLCAAIFQSPWLCPFEFSPRLSSSHIHTPFSLSFFSFLRPHLHLWPSPILLSALYVLQTFLTHQHVPKSPSFYSPLNTFIFFSLSLSSFVRQITTLLCAQSPSSSLPLTPPLCLFPSGSPLCCCLSCLFSLYLHYCLLHALSASTFICVGWVVGEKEFISSVPSFALWVYTTTPPYPCSLRGWSVFLSALFIHTLSPSPLQWSSRARGKEREHDMARAYLHWSFIL